MIPFILKALKLNIYITGAILALMVLILSTHESQAQRLLKGEKISSPNAKTKQAATKTSTINTRVLTDTIRSGKDSLSKAATDSLKKEEGLQTTVTYSASDSTIMDTEKQIVYLYGDATVKYGDISLQADYIQLNWDKNEVYARGTRDSSKVRAKGKPVFTQGSDKYDSEEIRYNFKSKKAIIQTIITKQGDGFIHGGKVKKDDEDNLYISDAVYTTCNLLHPHFSIRASRIKVVGKKEIVSGPFRFELNQIPIPLPLPFGFFPYSQPKESGKSGIIVPTYGEEPTGRGFYLRDGGYYWAASPNIGVRFTGQIYSKGGWGLGVNSQYVRRYRYAGNFNLAFTNNSNGSEITPQTRQDFSLQWAHSPQSRGNSSFSASVNIASNSYNQNNSYNTQNYISNTASSSVQYTKNFGQTIRTGISLRVNQNTTTKVFDAGTDFNFGLNQFQPFKKKNAVQERFIDQFRFGLNFNGSVSVTNVIANATNPFDFPVYTKGTDASSIVRPGDILTTTTITDRNQTNSNNGYNIRF
ncbi:putative LPS assembly protein LptD [Pseudarcicella hirudinis]|uniref:putative LPS assembly protein LptD n=1 Tax=Pseudarcicella hirudinis TaxID=1079859 RepID=UPI0035E7EA84